MAATAIQQPTDFSFFVATRQAKVTMTVNCTVNVCTLDVHVHTHHPKSVSWFILCMPMNVEFGVEIRKREKNAILKKQLNYNALMSYHNNLFYFFAKRKKRIFHVNGAILMRITVALKAIASWKNLLPFEKCIMKNLHQFFTGVKKIKLWFCNWFRSFFFLLVSILRIKISTSKPLSRWLLLVRSSGQGYSMVEQRGLFEFTI